MEIIKKGKLPEEKTYECVCSYCKTEFRFQRKEAEFVYDQRDGNALTIKCPLCKSQVWMAVKE